MTELIGKCYMRALTKVNASSEIQYFGIKVFNIFANGDLRVIKIDYIHDLVNEDYKILSIGFESIDEKDLVKYFEVPKGHLINLLEECEKMFGKIKYAIKNR